jgi:hypothetical protein
MTISPTKALSRFTKVYSRYSFLTKMNFLVTSKKFKHCKNEPDFLLLKKSRTKILLDEQVWYGWIFPDSTIWETGSPACRMKLVGHSLYMPKG